MSEFKDAKNANEWGSVRKTATLCLIFAFSCGKMLLKEVLRIELDFVREHRRKYEQEEEKE